MADNYRGAAQKHLDDSKELLDRGRYDGAGYLCGYVLECGWKSFLDAYGSPSAVSNHDLTQIQGQGLGLASGLDARFHRIMVDLNRASILNGTIRWSPDIRYQGVGYVSEVAARQWYRDVEFMLTNVIKKLAADNKL